jgi:hypothetical protein
LTWLLLVASLSGNHGALRLRVWRSMKGLGAVALRDGVYVAPATQTVHEEFKQQAADVVAAEGSAFVFTVSEGEAQEHGLSALFDRSSQYENAIAATDTLKREIGRINEVDARRRLRQLNRDFASIEATDFFPGTARDRAAAALDDLRRAIDATYSPEEPIAIHAAIPRYDTVAFQGKTWATRAHAWADRICSAWLIRRFIDGNAKFLWLEHAADCPATAIGFDFDGAQFTHVEQYVTFEVLLRSFQLDGDYALRRIAAVVHQLDVGGGHAPEAAGFETLLAGARHECIEDAALLERMSAILDTLYRGFDSAGERS